MLTPRCHYLMGLVLTLMTWSSAANACLDRTAQELQAPPPLLELKHDRLVDLKRYFARPTTVDGYRAVVFGDNRLVFHSTRPNGKVECVERPVSVDQLNRIIRLAKDQDFFNQPAFSGGAVSCACSLIELALEGKSHQVQFGSTAAFPIHEVWYELRQILGLNDLICKFEGYETNEQCDQYQKELPAIHEGMRQHFQGKRVSNP